MAYDTTQAADAAALKARRERARGLSSRIAQAVEAVDMPQTFFDGERAMRAITVADRMLIRLPESPDADTSRPSPARLRLRAFADRVLAAIEALRMPKTFREAERASRCMLATDSLLTQLYTPPKPARRLRTDGFDPAAFQDEADDEPEDSKQATAALFERLDRVALSHARDVGFYPDGTACDPAAAPDPQRLACPEEIDIIDRWMSASNGKPRFADDALLPLAQIMTARANASERARARHSGLWPDGRAFTEDDGPLFVLSQRFAREVLKRPGADDKDVEEIPAGEPFPWWLIRNPDTG